MRPSVATHFYAVGDLVSLDTPMRSSADRNDVFVVKMRLPHVGPHLQYRVRTEGENYDRVVIEENLTRSSVTDPQRTPS